MLNIAPARNRTAGSFPAQYRTSRWPVRMETGKPAHPYILLFGRCVHQESAQVDLQTVSK